jgi:hypothetical protein
MPSCSIEQTLDCLIEKKNERLIEQESDYSFSFRHSRKVLLTVFLPVLLLLRHIVQIVDNLFLNQQFYPDLVVFKYLNTGFRLAFPQV